MNPKVEIQSLSISKSRNEQTAFNKYDIEASLEEVGSTDREASVKYTFILLSNPKNIRISVEGQTSITGTQSEISHYLSQDENNIPRIASTIYQDLFPLFYVISKSMQIPCPAFKLSSISAPSQNVAAQTAQVAETLTSQPSANAAADSLSNSEVQGNDIIEEIRQNQENVVGEANVHQA